MTDMNFEVSMTKGQLRNFMYQTYNAGLVDAEARIIKLLDDIAAPYGEGALISADLVKMLIKGENK